jgi:hypothetical protein
MNLYIKEHSWHCNESLKHKLMKSDTKNSMNESLDISEQGLDYEQILIKVYITDL